jgi:hypothetical protein
MEDATFLRIDLDSKPPMIHACHGASLPTFGRLLRPTPVEPQLRAGPYSPNQCRLFCQDEPFLQWVEDALYSLGDPSLTAGVAPTANISVLPSAPKMRSPASSARWAPRWAMPKRPSPT